MEASAPQRNRDIPAYSDAIVAAARNAKACIVSAGPSPPPDEGNTLASVIHRFRQRWERKFALTTDVAGCAPIRQVPNTWVLLKMSQVVKHSTISEAPLASRISRHLLDINRSREVSDGVR
jgi:hypothetical protein